MCDPPSILWQPTISRDIEYLPSEIFGMGVASDFGLLAGDSAPNVCAVPNAAGIAAANLSQPPSPPQARKESARPTDSMRPRSTTRPEQRRVWQREY